MTRSLQTLRRYFLIAASLVTATVAAGSARADNQAVGAMIGAGTGALVGSSLGGRDGAIVGGLIGAVAGVAIANEHRRAPVYYAPEPVYGYAPAPAPVYGYAPQPAYAYAPPPVRSYVPPPVHVAPAYYPQQAWRGRQYDYRYERHHHRHGHHDDRDWGYNRYYN